MWGRGCQLVTRNKNGFRQTWGQKEEELCKEHTGSGTAEYAAYQQRYEELQPSARSIIGPYDFAPTLHTLDGIVRSFSGPFTDEFYVRQLERKHRVLCVLTSVAEGFWEGTIDRWERHGRQQPPAHVAYHIVATVRDVVDDMIGQLAKEGKRPAPSDDSDGDGDDDPADESSLTCPAAAQQLTLAEWGHARLLDDGRILYREKVVARPPYYVGDPVYIRREGRYHGIDDIMLMIRSWNSMRDGLALSQRTVRHLPPLLRAQR